VFIIIDSVLLGRLSNTPRKIIQTAI
jgi:hypothetical protein